MAVVRLPRGASPVLYLTLTLLAVACSAPEDRSADETASGIWFEESAAAAGVDFVHDSGHRGPHYMPEAVSGGAGLFDMDGDGDLDLYLTQGGNLADRRDAPPNRLYENLGDGSFRDVTEASGAGDIGYGMGVTCGDYDSDGDVDLYLSNFGKNKLLQNDGTGRFTDVTDAEGVGDESWSASAVFLDADGDRDLDLFVTNYVNWNLSADSFTCQNKLGTEDYCGPLTYNAPARDLLYLRHDDRYVDASADAGLHAKFGNGLGVLAGDFNDDGRLDLFVANDMNPDQLWINQGQARFQDEALLAGTAVDLEGGRPKAGMGVTAGDVDSDGDLDLMVCNLVESSDSVFRNEGRYFSDVTAASGLGTVSRGYTRFGMGWVDFNNDGHLDLYQGNGRIMQAMPAHDQDNLFAEPNLLFRGLPGGRFEEVLPRGGTAKEALGASRGVAFGDLDNDGGMDVVVVNRDAPIQLLRNRVTARGHWIGLTVLESSGGPAEGATVTLTVGDRSLRRDVRSAYSYLSCNDSRVHFGLGDSVAVDEVEVQWTDGVRTRHPAPSVDRYSVIRRDDGASIGL